MGVILWARYPCTWRPPRIHLRGGLPVNTHGAPSPHIPTGGPPCTYLRGARVHTYGGAVGTPPIHTCGGGGRGGPIHTYWGAPVDDTHGRMHERGHHWEDRPPHASLCVPCATRIGSLVEWPCVPGNGASDTVIGAIGIVPGGVVCGGVRGTLALRGLVEGCKLRVEGSGFMAGGGGLRVED